MKLPYRPSWWTCLSESLESMSTKTSQGRVMMLEFINAIALSILQLLNSWRRREKERKIKVVNFIFYISSID
ncbi:hypothetical protein H5410_035619 [Solanum commersonii]|uniref:Uncharacterized protein n=1 Tax=Solanum commersonii TaxID=4109 RepID=A0A9J5Y171_SOLCO|nr:hypothetical protein H5410_035619 [Solanum commersonii]